MSQTNVLYRLQQLDLAVQAKRERAREIKALIEEDSALRKAQASVDDLEAALRPKETRARDLTLEMKTVSEQSKQLGDRLYGGKVGNPKELEDIQNKIAERDRRHDHLETSMLEVMIEIENLQSALAEARQHLAQVKSERASEHKALRAEFKQLKAELDDLKAQRKATASELTKENLELYKTLRDKKQGLAVARLEGDSCSVCGVRQTTSIAQQVRQGDVIVTCTSCGRILVAV